MSLGGKKIMSIESALIKYLITSGRTTLKFKFDCALIPVEYLIYFSSSNNAYVREKIADNKNIPVATIEKLSYDEDRYVRLAIARNPNTPMQILNRLHNDNYWGVREAAKRSKMVLVIAACPSMR